MNLGVSLSSLSRYEEAVKEYKKSIEIIERLVLSGRTEIENELAKAYMNLGNALCYLTRYEEAVEEYKKTIEIKERLVLSGRTEIENELAGAYVSLGNALRYLTHYEEAVKKYKKAMEIIERLVERSQFWLYPDLLMCYGNMILLGSNKADYKEYAMTSASKVISLLLNLSVKGKITHQIARIVTEFFKVILENRFFTSEQEKDVETLAEAFGITRN
jgi:tetratricopeptide (TPR) repeat protein